MATSQGLIDVWMQGWIAATHAMQQSLQHVLAHHGARDDARVAAAAIKEVAGNKPSLARRRGRPPLSAARAESDAAGQAKRRRGRPPKSARP